MKKKLVMLILISAIMVGAFGCQPADAETIREFEKSDIGIVRLPNGTIIEGVCDDYRAYSTDIARITIDSVTYLTSAENIVIISE